MSKFDDNDGEEKKNLNFSWLPSGCSALAGGFLFPFHYLFVAYVNYMCSIL